MRDFLDFFNILILVDTSMFFSWLTQKLSHWLCVPESVFHCKIESSFETVELKLTHLISILIDPLPIKLAPFLAHRIVNLLLSRKTILYLSRSPLSFDGNLKKFRLKVNLLIVLFP